MKQRKYSVSLKIQTHMRSAIEVWIFEVSWIYKSEVCRPVQMGPRKPYFRSFQISDGPEFKLHCTKQGTG